VPYGAEARVLPEGTVATVLIVEDDVDIRETVRELLEDEGYHVLVAENGERALEALERPKPGDRPCLILVDLLMPVMDGRALIEALHQRRDLSQIPVIVMSALGSLGGLPPGTRVLRKPLAVDNFLAAIEEHCPAHSQ